SQPTWIVQPELGDGACGFRAILPGVSSGDGTFNGSTVTISSEGIAHNTSPRRF
ncbi:unnamed protein product, partial [Ascophyllum nodosum]